MYHSDSTLNSLCKQLHVAVFRPNETSFIANCAKDVKPFAKTSTTCRQKNGNILLGSCYQK